MARTPLLSALQRLAAEHRLADRLGVSPEAAREYSRGEFLKRAGGAGAVAVAGPALLAQAARAQSTPRVAIVGGGIAGLNAALTLADAGVPSTVYESNPTRLGGRMHSAAAAVGDDYYSGQVTEYCGEFIDSDHNTIISLCKRFGLPLDDVLQVEPNGSTETYFFQNGYYAYKQASLDFQPVHNTLQGQIQAAPFPTTYKTTGQPAIALDNMSVYDWIEQYVPGGHASNFGLLLDSAYNQEYGADTTDQSSLNIVYLLGYHAKPGTFQIYGASDERYHIRGGNQQLPETIAAYAQSTGLTTIAQGARMNTIALNADGTVSLWFDGSPKPVVFDQVILAMSFSVLRTLNYQNAGFDPLKKTAIAQLGSGRNAKLALQFDQRYWNGSGPWGISNGDVYTDIGFQNTWDSTRAQSGTNGIMVNYTGGSVAGAIAPSTPYSNATTNAKQVTGYASAFLKQVERVFPGITPHWNGKATLSTPFLDPNLLCSYSYWRVGQYTGFSGYEMVQQGPAGQIHFAGEHCSINFQGYMEGGAEEGQRAANEVLASLPKK